MSLSGYVGRSIVFAPDSDIDFGTVKAGTFVHRSVTFQSGDGKALNLRALKITGANAGAISARVSVLKRTSGVITATMHAPRVAGSYGAICELDFADKRPSYRINIGGLVKSAYDVRPSLVNYGTEHPGVKVTRTVIITGPSVSLMKIRHVPKQMSCELTVRGKKATLTAAWQVSSAVDQSFDGRIELSTGNLSEPTVDIPAYGVPVY
jgi:hypothetical protein